LKLLWQKQTIDLDRPIGKPPQGRFFSSPLRTFKATLDEWMKSVSELATWIRYSPPPPGAKPIETWLEDQSEEDDAGRGRDND
jgi:hypothetical protein